MCDDKNGWPPFIYRKNNKTIGASYEILDMIFRKNRIKYTINFMSWHDCIFAASQNIEANGIMNASYNRKRARFFYYSRPLYQTKPAVFYSIKKYTNGLNLRRLNDLKKFKICGIRGYNYAHYKLGSTLMTQLGDMKKVFRGLSYGGCEIFPSEVEIPFGLALIGKLRIGSDIEWKRIPGIKYNNFYLMLSKKYVHARKVLGIVNREVKRLRKMGTEKMVFQKYLPNF